VSTGVLLYFISSKFNRELEEKIREQEMTNKTLEFERKRLKESNEQLEHFADMASHDLKSPLRTILNLIQRYKTKFSGDLTPGNLEYLDVIENSANLLSRKVDKTLLFSKISNTSGEYEMVDTQNVIKNIIFALSKDIEEKNAQISYENLPRVYSDIIMLQQVFQNVIENSLKYCKPNEKPDITIHGVKKDKKILFEISDNGIGIPESEQEKVFERFKQLNNSDLMKGNGIGLASIKRIVSKLGGNIWIESTVGEGTSVFIELPSARH
jgi:signal transduction histidine kinase